mmetsp:Transcript_68746/g.212569  ORF Transcript_68746/g.212569 Transcript_68746/m.212569 type:complete len:319 (+) Transcript_68746:1335-2291(+)
MAPAPVDVEVPVAADEALHRVRPDPARKAPLRAVPCIVRRADAGALAVTARGAPPAHVGVRDLLLVLDDVPAERPQRAVQHANDGLIRRVALQAGRDEVVGGVPEAVVDGLDGGRRVPRGEGDDPGADAVEGVRDRPNVRRELVAGLLRQEPGHHGGHLDEDRLDGADELLSVPGLGEGGDVFPNACSCRRQLPEGVHPRRAEGGVVGCGPRALGEESLDCEQQSDAQRGDAPADVCRRLHEELRPCLDGLHPGQQGLRDRLGRASAGSDVRRAGGICGLQGRRRPCRGRTAPQRFLRLGVLLVRPGLRALRVLDLDE